MLYVALFKLKPSLMGSLEVLLFLVFLETELSWTQKYYHLFKPQWVKAIIYNVLYEPQS